MTTRSRTSLLPALVALFLATEARADCPNWLPGMIDHGVYPNGANNEVHSIMPFDPDGAGPLAETLVMAGYFTAVEGVPAKYLAMRNPQTGKWEALGNVDGTAGYNALTVFEGNLIAGGGGDADPTDRDDNILRWDGSQWKSMGGGTSVHGVNVLHVHNGVLYAGGTFDILRPQQSTISHIARWNPSLEDWEPVPGGTLSSSVNAMLTFGADLVAGGNFVTIGGVPVDYVAKHNGSAWSAMGAGFQGGGVGALQVYNGSLYAGGNLGSSGGLTTGGLARWNGASWVPVGTIFPGQVHSLGVHAGQLVISGNFVHTAQNIEQYNGGAYSPIGGLGMTLSSYCIRSHGGLLYIGGAFTQAGAVPASRVAVWDGITWLPMGGGVAGQVRAFTDYFGRFIVAGGFDQSAEPGSPAHNLVGWDGSRLYPYGTGTNGLVIALESFKHPGILGSYELVAGGLFTSAGGVSASRIARWDERPNVIGDNPAWKAMGAGFNNGVYAIERHSSATYAGGTFTLSGATTVNRIARWNETSSVWEAMSTGMNGTVYALKSFGGLLYAGGSFTTAGGSSTGGLARWNGSSWSAVGGVFNGTVYALEIHDGNLVVAGNFPNGSSPNITSWNGASYVNPAPGGTDGEVYSLHSFGGRLHVGGAFLHVGAGIAAARVASYGAGGWAETEGGADDFVYALSNFGGELQAGGWFGTVLGGALASPRWARYSTSGAPWISSNPWGQTVPVGGTAQFTSTFVPGTNPINVQWLRYDLPLVDGPQAHGSTISGATTATLKIANVSGYDVGQYRLVVASFCGADTSATARLDLPYVTGVEPLGPAATPTAFEAVAPNPTRGPSTITFALEHDADVRMRLHDVSGRIVRVRSLGRMSAGRHQAPWNVRTSSEGAVRPGVYFLRLEVDGRPIGTKRLAVL